MSFAKRLVISLTLAAICVSGFAREFARPVAKAQRNFAVAPNAATAFAHQDGGRR
jgi:hypothetical protein